MCLLGYQLWLHYFGFQASYHNIKFISDLIFLIHVGPLGMNTWIRSFVIIASWNNSDNICLVSTETDDVWDRLFVIFDFCEMSRSSSLLKIELNILALTEVKSRSIVSQRVSFWWTVSVRYGNSEYKSEPLRLPLCRLWRGQSRGELRCHTNGSWDFIQFTVVRFLLWRDAWTSVACSQRSTAETFIARQRLAKHVSAATNMDAIIEEILEVVISIRSFQKL
jgi:hypothetical protein